jgi:beta-galactosidase/beta-glucuronidase
MNQPSARAAWRYATTSLLLMMLAAAVPAVGRGAPPPPAGGAPQTPWSKEVGFDHQPLPEYPRPQFVRDEWLNLNGKWEFAITPHDGGRPEKFDRAILVPFAPQAPLSQINQWVGPESDVWYRREFELPAGWEGKRILLHFGAVNWECHVRFNGRNAGSHTGGYDGFTLDVSEFVHTSGKQEITVCAWGPIEGGQPRGKQALKPQGIFYTPTTGIWQTVWLEPVNEASIDHVRITPDLDRGEVRITPAIASLPGPALSHASLPNATLRVSAVVLADGKEVGHATGGPTDTIAIPLPNARLWSPASPFLYDLKLTLEDAQTGQPLDTVTSYFGMRKISIGPGPRGALRILLNNRPVFQNGLLDQGFWPDGIYTAPTDAALKYDLETLRKVGFNMDRKHIKVEPERWYYWADKLGVLVWQDMPATPDMGYPERDHMIADREGVFESELRRMIRGRANHPSVVMWVLFNEGWGLPLRDRPQGKGPIIASPIAGLREQRMLAAAREEDPTRLIDAESGAGGGGTDHGEDVFDFGYGDVIDYHCYGHAGPTPEKTRAAVVGEYGWGVSPVGALRNRMKASGGVDISGVVLTQLTDVENEHNGVMNYSRQLIPGIAREKDLPGDIRKVLHEFGEDDYPGGQEEPR